MVHENFTENHESEYLSDCESPNSPGSSKGTMMSIPEESQMLPMPPHNALFCTRKQREFTPDSKKDDTYWDRRRRNNAAAKRSREKRRLNDMLLEKRVIQLSRENHILRAQVQAVQQSYGIRADALIDMDQVMATLPSEDALLNMTCSPSSSSRRMSSPPPLPATMINLEPNRPNTPPSPQSRPSFAPSPPQSRPSFGCSPPPQRPSFASSPPQNRPSFGCSPPPQRPQFGSPSPTASTLDEVYRQCLNATQSSLQQKAEAAAAATRALYYGGGQANGGDIGGPPPQKRPYSQTTYDSYADSHRTPSSGSSECGSTPSGDDALNLTCKSRSRSSSDTEDAAMNSGNISATSEDDGMSHQMPHKLRLKYQYQSQEEFESEI